MKNKVILLSATLLFLLFANGRFSVFFATWIAAALLLFWVRSQSPLKGFLWAWLLLSVAWLFQFKGMVPVPLPFYVTIAIFYGLIGSIPYLLDLILVKNRRAFSQTLIFPCSWAIVDYAIQYSPYGSWGHTAYSQHTQLLLLQSVSVFGMSYVTFLIGWFASICNWSFTQNFEFSKLKKGMFIYGSVVILTISFGSARLYIQSPTSINVRVASISAIQKEDQKLTPEMQFRIINRQLTAEDSALLKSRTMADNQRLFDRSEKEAKAGAKIIFWGEANASIFKQDEEILFELASQFAKKHGIYLGLGLGTINLESEKFLENKLVLFAPNGQRVIDYWKVLPVPGSEAAISALKDDIIQSINTPFGIIAGVICFDMDFPQHLTQASNADVLLAPSNDWREIDPWHTHMAKFRAIEQGFNLVRHTSNGLSASFDYTGRIISKMDHYSDQDKILISHVPTKGVRTLFSFIGDIFPFSCLFFLVTFVLISRRERKQV